MHRFVKATFFTVAVVTFALHGFLIQLFVRDLQRRRRLLTGNVSRYSLATLKVFGVHVTVEGDVVKEPVLFVSNHLSYLDMLVLSVVKSSVFVTSVDMGEVPFLGSLAEIGGSLFIERRHRERVGHDLEQIAQVLRDGFSVTLFPEGTSSNGETVLPFKRGLLMSAVMAGRQVQPVTLRYETIDGELFDVNNRDFVCWYGAMSFAPHLWALMSRAEISARLLFHSPLTFKSGVTKEQIAQVCHKLVAGSYGPRPSPVPPRLSRTNDDPYWPPLEAR